MKIAFTAKGTGWDDPMDPRFGRAPYILILDTVSNELIPVDNKANADAAHGAGPQTAQKLFDHQAEVLLTGNGPGGNAAVVLDKAGIKIFTGAGEMNVRQTYEAYKNGQLKEFVNA